MGRFISSDPIQDGDNWYAYCDNNPLAGSDPKGLQWGAQDPVHRPNAVYSDIKIDTIGELKFIASGLWHGVRVAAGTFANISARGNHQPDPFDGDGNPYREGEDPGLGTERGGGGSSSGNNKIIPRRGGAGPSGKPKIHEKTYPTQKAAREGAKRGGYGQPEHHPNPTVGKPHYHPTDQDNEIIKDGVHHTYPK